VTPVLRPATADDAAQVAELFHRGWHDGHRGHVPDGLTRRRTPEAFRERVERRIADTEDTTVAEVDGVVAGFIMVAGDEVEQVYVDRTFRGSGVADLLLAEAERQVAGAGHPSAWLAVVVGNARARAFYARHGWRDEGDLAYDVVALGEHFTSPCRRYVKDVAPG
jgi:GNAT superfamily N-acetyltransferase